MKRALVSPHYLQVFLTFPEALGSGTAQVGTPSLGKTKTWRTTQTVTIPMAMTISVMILSYRFFRPFPPPQPFPWAS